MILDFIIAAFFGFKLGSFWVFSVLVLLASVFARRERPWSSGLLRLCLMLLGVSAVLSLFGDSGHDCDCDG